MIYRLLADIVTIAHLIFVVFVILGGLLAFRWPRLVWIHVPAAAWGAFVELSGRVCPLTPLEIWLRLQGGEVGYSGDFVDRYLIPVLYPGNLTHEIQLLLGLTLIGGNAVIYLLLWHRHRS